MGMRGLLVCHTCGTKYGEMDFEDRLRISPGVCDLCHSEGSVAEERFYRNLPALGEMERASAERRRVMEARNGE